MIWQIGLVVLEVIWCCTRLIFFFLSCMQTWKYTWSWICVDSCFGNYWLVCKNVFLFFVLSFFFHLYSMQRWWCACYILEIGLTGCLESFFLQDFFPSFVLLFYLIYLFFFRLFSRKSWWYFCYILETGLTWIVLESIFYKPFFHPLFLLFYLLFFRLFSMQSWWYVCYSWNWLNPCLSQSFFSSM